MAVVHKNWCFTLFSADCQVAARALAKNWQNSLDVNYAIAGLETCPDTGRKHLQGYLQLSKKRAMRTVTLLFTNVDISYKPHIEAQRAQDVKDAIQYCRKDGDVLVEVGEPNLGKQRARNDLKRVREAIVEGKSLNDLYRDEPESYGTLVRYFKGIQRSIYPLQKKSRQAIPVESEWHYGLTGAGKSFFAFSQETDECPAYIKDNTKWWNEYDGEELVIWDDIRPYPNIDLSVILRLLDGRLRLAESKGGYVRVLARRVIFTCPWSIYEFGSKLPNEDILQLRRRVTKIVRYVRRDLVTVEKPLSVQ